MERIFGFDIGTTSIGFAVIDYDRAASIGKILRLGVRIFPEARDPDGTPLNQQRRQKRMVRRQLRRRRQRRRLLNELLSGAGLLPPFGSSEWAEVMRSDPYALRARGLTAALSAHEVGRALYHLAKRRHFRGRDLETEDEAGAGADAKEDADETASKTVREATLQALKAENLTLGAWLSLHGPHDRKRGVHASRRIVEEEFDALVTAQSEHHAVLLDQEFLARVRDSTFSQRPVFWRKNTLGECRFMPGEPLCPKGSWLSQQRRMLEKLNTLAVAGGNARPLDDEERGAILKGLQVQASMSWPGVRSAMKPLFKARGDAGGEKKLKFNLELGGESKLLGNAVEAKLAKIFGTDWPDHPHKQAIRDAVHHRLWTADYGEIGTQRVVILSASEREANRGAAARSFVDDFGVACEQAEQLATMSFPTGWEPYSTRALEAFMPHLNAGERFGALVNGPAWEEWRNETFPNQDRPTGECLDRLPSPAVREERKRIAKLRNPTVVRTQNELRKVVNNLIGLYGKPDLIRVELARDVGKSKREREEIQSGIRRNERRRREAAKDLASKGIAEPSRDDIEKWMLWKEGQERCPYTGDQIGFEALFGEGRYEVEHIWPRSRSFDDSARNKTLCRKDINIDKGNRTPYEYLGGDADRWAAVKTRLQGMITPKGGAGMPPGKVKRFVAESIPEGFVERQLNDTGYAARQAVEFLKRLWPDVGPAAPVNVQVVTGRVTAQLRKLWTLNNILGSDGEKTREDHRHHAIDALAVACTHPGMSNQLSRYWQQKDDPRATKPALPPPWPTIRSDAEHAVAKTVVSHRVRKRVSGPLHKETVYGDTGNDVTTKAGSFRQFVSRKKVESLSKGELDDIRDERVRDIIKNWVSKRGGDPKRAFPPYPQVNSGGPEIRKVRLVSKQQMRLMAPVSTGFSDFGSNHHIAIYRRSDGDLDFEVVSLFEAAQRIARHEPIVVRSRTDGEEFVMSLSPRDVVEFQSGEQAGYWLVQGVSAAGRPTLSRITDARPTTATESRKLKMAGTRQDFEPRFGGFMSRNPRKVSVDPIGRVRKASD